MPVGGDAQSGAVAPKDTVRLTPKALGAALLSLALHDRTRLAAMLLRQQQEG
jgi:hypothetical protein